MTSSRLGNLVIFVSFKALDQISLPITFEYVSHVLPEDYVYLIFSLNQAPPGDFRTAKFSHSKHLFGPKDANRASPSPSFSCHTYPSSSFCHLLPFVKKPNFPSLRKVHANQLIT
jgi:hypothetical protein